MLPCGEREPSLVGTGVLDGPDVFAPHNAASVSLPQWGKAEELVFEFF